MRKQQDVREDPYWEDFSRAMSLLIANSQQLFSSFLLTVLGFIPRTAPSVEELMKWALLKKLVCKCGKAGEGTTLYESHYLRDRHNICYHPVAEVEPGAACEMIEVLRTNLMFTEVLRWLSGQCWLVYHWDHVWLEPSDCPVLSAEETEIFLELMEDLSCVSVFYRDNRNKWPVTYYEVLGQRCTEVLRAVENSYYVPADTTLSLPKMADILYQMHYGMEYIVSGHRNPELLTCEAQLYVAALQYLQAYKTVKVNADSGEGLPCFPIEEIDLHALFFEELAYFGIIVVVSNTKKEIAYRVYEDRLAQILSAQHKPDDMLELVEDARKWQRRKGRKKKEPAVRVPEGNDSIICSLIADLSGGNGKWVEGSSVRTAMFNHLQWCNKSPAIVGVSLHCAVAHGFVEKRGEKEGSKYRVCSL